MAHTLNLSIQLDRDLDVTEFARSSQKRASITKTINLLAGIESGTVQGSVQVQTGAGITPAAASGTITITYASIAANDTVSIGQTTFTCKASGANGTTEFNKVTDATATAASLVVAINANTTTSKYCTASNVAGVVTVAMKERSYLGNAVVLAKVSTGGIVVVQPTGGAGPSSASVSFA